MNDYETEKESRRNLVMEEKKESQIQKKDRKDEKTRASALRRICIV